jgi:hypothetical protein
MLVITPDMTGAFTAAQGGGKIWPSKQSQSSEFKAALTGLGDLGASW